MDRMAEEGYFLRRINNAAVASKPNLYANVLRNGGVWSGS
jgi:hypothetical protein